MGARSGTRRCFQLQWKDPITGRKKTKSSGVERTGRKQQRTEAERAAAKFEAELREGRYHAPLRVTWAEFRQRYESEVLPGLAAGTERKVASMFGWVEKVLRPNRLVELTEGRISHLVAEMRGAGLAEATIGSTLAHLAAALNWAHRLGILLRVPKIEKPRRAKGSKVMRGRPIAGEEFDRLLAAVPKVVGQETAASWCHYLRGLWVSGLRLAESMELFWDRADRLCVDLSGQYPMVRIPAELEKGHQDRLLPIAPEFAELLLATPEADRTGPVFNPRSRGNGRTRLLPHRVGELVAEIGRVAGIKVHTDPSTGKVKYASAHDLRRSFGQRWAGRIMPPDLMVLMRHEDIETTLRYYVGRNAANTAKTLWRAVENGRFGNTLGNTAAESSSANDEAPPQPLDATELRK